MFGYTENGALSLNTTGDARLDLFTKATRDLGSFEKDHDNAQLYGLIDASWQVDPLDTLKILMNWRDCRGGKGDYSGFIAAIAYISKTRPEWVNANIAVIPEFGSYLDLVKLWHVCSLSVRPMIMKFIKTTLLNDLRALDDSSVRPSLLAKWIPSEGGKWDCYSKKCRFSHALCKALFAIENVKSQHLKTLRTQIISPLRAHLKLTECAMCDGKFESIVYEHVPSVAMKKYNRAFIRHDKDRFSSYINDVKLGVKKINASQLYPHDLVRAYLKNNITSPDEVIEAQWREIKRKTDDLGVFARSVCVCDVSASMSGTPMEVAIALGLLCMNENRLITFSENPELFYVDADTSLFHQVKQLATEMPWGGNTNFERAMDIVLGMSSTTPIDRVYIFSDMQFDIAMRNTHTHYEILQQRFAKAGIHKMPQIVFWNLRGDTSDFPVQKHEMNTIILSGYSPNILTALLNGTDVTPLSIMLGVIHSPRYDNVVRPHDSPV